VKNGRLEHRSPAGRSDLIATIRSQHQYIGHYHTGGVPGCHALDDTQEVNWRAACRAIVDTGFTGYLAHEFVPTPDPLTSLREAVALCDVSSNRENCGDYPLIVDGRMARKCPGKIAQRQASAIACKSTTCGWTRRVTNRQLPKIWPKSAISCAICSPLPTAPSLRRVMDEGRPP
jgi:hypothetical protein